VTLTDPLLLVVHGPPGSGKSTLARALARELHFSVFEKDVFKDLAFETFGASDREWSKRVGALSIELLYLCATQLLTVGFEDRAMFLEDLRARPHGALGLADALLEIDTTTTFPSAAKVAAWSRKQS